MDIDRDIHLISCSSTLHKIAHYDGILVYLKYETCKYSFPVEKENWWRAPAPVGYSIIRNGYTPRDWYTKHWQKS